MNKVYIQQSLLSEADQVMIHEQLLKTHIKEIAEPLDIDDCSFNEAGEEPTCQCCGRLASEWVCLDGAYYHLNVETCIRNTRYNRNIDIKQWLSNPVASTYKTVNVKVLAR